MRLGLTWFILLFGTLFCCFLLFSTVRIEQVVIFSIQIASNWRIICTNSQAGLVTVHDGFFGLEWAHNLSTNRSLIDQKPRFAPLLKQSSSSWIFVYVSPRNYPRLLRLKSLPPQLRLATIEWVMWLVCCFLSNNSILLVLVWHVYVCIFVYLATF